MDLGAGNCWMSIRLANAGQRVVATDINMDSYDGLGVATRLWVSGQTKFPCVRGEFDYLPLADASFDAIVCNASLHYSKNVIGTLLRALRHLKDDGVLYILDSPIYNDAESGQLMIRERQEAFRKNYGIPIPDEFAGNFLTYEELNGLQPDYCVEYLTPHYGLVWNLRPILAHVLKKRQPASFEIVIVRKS